jgi:acyl-coenzyme A synthetase/AMP-(fatty) acid ligase
LIFLVPTMLPPLLQALSPDRAGALRWVVSGGETMAPWVRDACHATLPGTVLVNAFGPTEGGPVTDNVIPRGSGAPTVPVGRPAPNFRITLLDENLDLVPVGMAGEAYLSGEIGLAYGYWRAPARTAERFVADPYGSPGDRMYRTGDLCRYRDNGLLEHLGRIDRQVKLRGMRIEPGEIESALAGHPAVGDCAVLAHGDPVRLLAFAVPAGGSGVGDVDPAAILAHAARLLPDHMVPDRVVPVGQIPATVNGKTDEAELIRIWTAVVDRERDLVPPSYDLEASLVEIYSRVLNVTPVSVLDTFVQLGGHSLLAFQLLDECEQRLHAKPAVGALLTKTLRDVAASMRDVRDGGGR